MGDDLRQGHRAHPRVMQAATQSWLRGGADQVCTPRRSARKCRAARGYDASIVPPWVRGLRGFGASVGFDVGSKGICVYPPNRVVHHDSACCSRAKVDIHDAWHDAWPRYRGGMAVSFALQAGLDDPIAFAKLARRAEAARFSTFMVADHPGTTPSPFVRARGGRRRDVADRAGHVCRKRRRARPAPPGGRRRDARSRLTRTRPARHRRGPYARRMDDVRTGVPTTGCARPPGSSSRWR